MAASMNMALYGQKFIKSFIINATSFWLNPSWEAQTLQHIGADSPPQRLLRHMARPIRPSEHKTFRIESQVSNREGWVTKIDFKAIHFLADDTFYWEIRHILADFYGDDKELDANFETSKIIKKKFDSVNKVLEELCYRLYQVLLPSRKGFETNKKKDFYLGNDVDSDKIQDECPHGGTMEP